MQFAKTKQNKEPNFLKRITNFCYFGFYYLEVLKQERCRLLFLHTTVIVTGVADNIGECIQRMRNSLDEDINENTINSDSAKILERIYHCFNNKVGDTTANGN